MALTKVTGGVVSPSSDYAINNVTGVAATFTGNVSIGGTLTYQDVSNIDAVGIITAQKGIQITGDGLNVTAGIATFATDIHVGENIKHIGDTDTKIVFTDNQIDFHAHSSSRLYVNQYAVYIQTGHPLAFLATGGGATPHIKSGGTNNQDLLFTTGAGNPTRIHIKSDGKVGIGTDDPNSRLDVTKDSGTDYSATTDQRSSAQIIARNNTAGTNNFASISLVNGGGTQAEASINLIETDSYLGDITFKSRSGGSTWSEKLRIASDGEVGIGTVNPNAPLDVFSNTAATDKDLFMVRSATGAFAVQCSNIAAANPEWRLRTYSSEPIVFSPGNVEKVRITSDGAVGINSTTPTANYRLDVNGDLTLGEKGGVSNTYIDQKQDGDLHLINSGRTANGASGSPGTAGVGINRFNDISGGTSLFRDFAVYNGKNSKVLVVDGSASAVGIGTDAPTNALDVQGGTTNTAIVARSTDAKAQISLLDNATTSVGSVVLGAEGDDLFLTSGSGGAERLRIASTGRVAIGNATNNASPTALLGVIADDGEAADLYVGKFHNLEATAGQSFGVDIRAGSNTSDHGFRVKNRANSVTQFIVRGDGHIGIGIDAPTSKLYVNGVSTSDIITARAADTNGASVINILAEGTTGISRIKFSDTAAPTGDGWISYYHSDRAIAFATAGTSNERLRISSSGSLQSKGNGAIFEQVETNSYNGSWAAANGKIAIKGDLSGGNYFGWRQKNVASGSVTQANAEKKLPTLNDFTYPNSSNGMLIASTSKIGFAAAGESPQYSSGVTMLFDHNGLILGSTRAFDCSDTVSGATTALIKLRGSQGKIELNNPSSQSGRLTIKGTNSNGSTCYAVTNSGKAVEGIDVTCTTVGANNYGGAISFGCGGNGRSAIAAIQTGSDDDRNGLSFFTHGSSTGSNDTTERLRIDAYGSLNIGGRLDQTDDLLHVNSFEMNKEAIGIGASSQGIRLGWKGDNSAYDSSRIYRTDYSTSEQFGMGASWPCMVITPTTAPGSGISNETLWLKSTGSGSGSTSMHLTVDGTTVIGGNGKVNGGTTSGYPQSRRAGFGDSKLTIQPNDRTSAFAAATGSTWHDVVIKQSANAANNAVGIAFEVSTSGYHHNAGTGIAAIKNGTTGDYGCHLAFITRPQSAVARDRLRINDNGLITATRGNGCIDGTWVYKQQNQSANYEHKIRGPLGGLLDTEMNTNSVAYIKVQCTGTGTNTAYCYYRWSQDGENLGATLTHIHGNSGSSSNNPWMVLDGQHPCWKTAHSTAYTYVVRVEITGGEHDLTFQSTANGDYGNAYTSNP